MFFLFFYAEGFEKDSSIPTADADIYHPQDVGTAYRVAAEILRPMKEGLPHKHYAVRQPYVAAIAGGDLRNNLRFGGF